MDPTIIVALIGFIGSIISIWATYQSNRTKITQEFEKANAEWQRQAENTDHKMELKLVEMSTRLEGLTVEVRKHNGFGERIPALEEKAKDLNERLKRVEKQ